MPPAALLSVLAALEMLTDTELRALIDAARRVQPIAPALLSSVESACHGELDRRRGRQTRYQSDWVIPPEEQAVSVDAALAMRAMGAQHEALRHKSVLAFFDALVALVTVEGRRQ